MRYKRITGAILDILLFLILTTTIISFVPMNENAQKLSNQLNAYASADDLTNEQRNEIPEIAYNLDKEIPYMYIIVALIILAYFVLIPKILNGQTIGYRIRKVRIVGENDDKVTTNQLIIMTLLNSGLVLVILFPFILYISNPIWYSRITSILAICQGLFWFISLILLFIKKRSLQDLVAKTKVIEVKR